MSAHFRLLVALLFAIPATVVVAAPPQPPLTADTLDEFAEEWIAIHKLRDNAFLFEEATRDYGERLAEWKDAPVILNLDVARVTKTVVLCELLPIDGIKIRNEKDLILDPDHPGREVALRIGDVVPLDVARRLRAGDQLLLSGILVASGFHQERGWNVEIGKASVVGVTARGDRGRIQSNQIDGADGHESRAEAQGRGGIETTPPSFSLKRAPRYPLLAVQRGWQGVVQLRLTIGEDGAVTSVAVDQSSGHEILDAAAVEAVRTWRGTPARRGGQAVATEELVPVRFRLQ